MGGRCSGSASDGLAFLPSILPWGCSPLRRSQSGESTSRRPLPFAALTAPFAVRLVARFHPGFGPPSPFLATLTGCSSPGPVTSFSHSRPWGSGSLLPRVDAVPLRPLDLRFPARGMGTAATGSRVVGLGSPRQRRLPASYRSTPRCCSALAGRFRRPPLQSPKCLVRLRLPVASTVRPSAFRSLPARFRGPSLGSSRALLLLRLPCSGHQFAPPKCRSLARPVGSAGQSVGLLLSDSAPALPGLPLSLPRRPLASC